MKWIILKVSILLLAIGCSDNSKIKLNSEFISTHSAYYGNHRYDFRFTTTDFEICPKWDFSDEMPSLGFKSAAMAARICLGSIVDNPKKWEIFRISLEALDEGNEWIYKVSFLSPPESSSNMREYVEIPVLLSGKTIKPSVHDDDLIK